MKSVACLMLLISTLLMSSVTNVSPVVAQAFLGGFVNISSKESRVEINCSPTFELCLDRDDKSIWAGGIGEGALRLPVGSILRIYFNPQTSDDYKITQMRAMLDDDITSTKEWNDVPVRGRRYCYEMSIENASTHTLQFQAEVHKGKRKAWYVFIWQVKTDRSTARANSLLHLTAVNVADLNRRSPPFEWRRVLMGLQTPGIFLDANKDEFFPRDDVRVDRRERTETAPVETVSVAPMPASPTAADMPQRQPVSVKVVRSPKLLTNLTQNGDVVQYRLTYWVDADDPVWQDIPFGQDGVFKIAIDEPAETILELRIVGKVDRKVKHSYPPLPIVNGSGKTLVDRTL